MAYDFNFAMSVSIGADTIEDMIRDIVEQQTGQKIKDITFQFRTKTVGMGLMERDETEFNGVLVTFVDNTARRFDFNKL